MRTHQDLHQVVSQITTGKIETEDGVGQSITLIDGHSVGHTITAVQHNTSGPAASVQGQDGLMRGGPEVVHAVRKTAGMWLYTPALAARQRLPAAAALAPFPRLNLARLWLAMTAVHRLLLLCLPGWPHTWLAR